MRCLNILGLLAVIGLASPVAAQERHLNFALGAGVVAAPSYPGAQTTQVGPDLNLTFGSLRWGRVYAGRGIGAVPDNGLSFQPAFRILGTRTAADNVELAGLTDIDIAVELGFGLVYQQTNWRAFGAVRKGVIGHSAVTGDLGADIIFRPNDRLTINAGPRVSFGDSDFASTYFGVTGAEATTSSFSAFDAQGGALGAGFSVAANYELNDRWSLNGAVGYEKLLGDAADSPITRAGSDDQWSLRIGLSREFTLRF